MTRTQARACEGKRRYDTKTSAQDHLAALTRKGATRARIQVYKCRYCGGYHVGHKIGSGGRRR